MSQNIVITGAGRGIGLALVKEYLKRGDQVWAVCRTVTDELKDCCSNIIENVDVTSTTDIQMMVERLANVRIDVLINNAGIFINEEFGSLNFDTITKQFLVNSLAPLQVTEALVNQFSNQAKVGLITSRMGSIEDNGSGAYYGYRMSKAALNAAGVSLAIDLKARGIAIAILHPGFVKTRMVGFSGDLSPELCAERLVERMDGLNLENSGTFWHSSGEELPW